MQTRILNANDMRDRFLGSQVQLALASARLGIAPDRLFEMDCFGQKTELLIPNIDSVLNDARMRAAELRSIRTGNSGAMMNEQSIQLREMKLAAMR